MKEEIRDKKDEAVSLGQTIANRVDANGERKILGESRVEMNQ